MRERVAMLEPRSQTQTAMSMRARRFSHHRDVTDDEVEYGSSV
jgi:hypothetical protein